MCESAVPALSMRDKGIRRSGNGRHDEINKKITKGVKITLLLMQDALFGGLCRV